MGKSGTNTKGAPAAAKGKSPIGKKAKVPTTAAATKSKKVGSKKGGKTAMESILEVLATFHANGKSVDKETVGKLAGIAAKTLSNNIPKLKKQQLIDVDGPTLSLTKAGVEKMGDLAKRPESNEEVLEKLKEGMSGKQLQLFEALKDGKVHGKNDIAMKLGYEKGSTTKGFVNLAGSMSGKKIVYYPAKDKIQLVMETCFPFGK